MKLKRFFSKKTALIAGMVLAVYTLAGFFLVPVLSRYFLVRQLGGVLHRDVTVESMTFNPFSLNAIVTGLTVRDKTGDGFAAIRRIRINLGALRLLTLTPWISELQVEGPHVKIIRLADGTWNFSDLIPPGTDPSSEGAEFAQGGAIPKLVLENVSVKQGIVEWDDRKTKVSHKLSDLNLTLPFLSTREKDRQTLVHLGLDFDLNGSGWDIMTESRPFDKNRTAGVDLKISGLDGTRYLAYLPIPETLTVSGLELGLEARADYADTDAGPVLEIGGRLGAERLDIREAPDKAILTLPVLDIRVASSNVLAGPIHISGVHLQSPELHLERDGKGDLTLLRHFPTRPKDHDPGKNPGSSDALTLVLDELSVQDGQVAFRDESNATVFESLLSPVNLKVTDLKAGEQLSGHYMLNLKTGDGETLDAQGDFQTNPLEAAGNLTLGQWIISRFAPYYEPYVNVAIKSGALDLFLDFEVSSKDSQPGLVIRNRESAIRALVLRERGSDEDIIRIPDITLSGSVVDLTRRQIQTGTLSAKDGRIKVVLNPRKEVNLAGMFVRAENKASDGGASSKQSDSETWDLLLNTFKADGFQVSFTDQSAGDPVDIQLTDLSVTAENFRTSGEEKGRVDARMVWNRNGRVHVHGELAPLHRRGKLDLDIDHIDIRTFQPYFDDFINVRVSRGDFAAKGGLRFDLGSDTAGRLAFAGEASVTRFESLEKETSKDFFKCNSLFLNGLTVSLFPVYAAAEEISLTDFYSRIIVDETGRLNLARIVKNAEGSGKDPGLEPETKPAQTEQTGKESVTPDIHIEGVTLQGGHIDFSDYMNKPNFNAGMKQIAGSLTGLSSDPKSRAKLHLQGVHGQSAPLEILGTVSPLAPKKYADIDLTFKDIELSNLTPYSSKYLGYKIKKGKLILDLKYIIDGDALKSRNRVRFDNFQLGDRVESPHATNMPIELAISLLKDREGRIDLDLPVEGRLNDPEFRIGPIILKMVTNLIVKVITSPFAVIGAMFGGGEELGYVDFDYGETEIRSENFEKLNTLAEILNGKPAVKLEIQGGYDALRDSERLREKRFEEKIQSGTQKGAQPAAIGNDSDKAGISPEAMARFIEQAYETAGFPKPKDEGGAEKQLDLEEKKKLLITHIQIDEADLRTFAMTRSENIKAYLADTGKVAPERIFLVEPVENKAEGDNGQNSRVRFLLK